MPNISEMRVGNECKRIRPRLVAFHNKHTYIFLFVYYVCVCVCVHTHAYLHDEEILSMEVEQII